MLFKRRRKSKSSGRSAHLFGAESLENRNLMTAVGFEGGAAELAVGPEEELVNNAIVSSEATPGDHDILFDPDGDLKPPQQGNGDEIDDLSGGEDPEQAIVQIRVKVKHAV